MFLKINFLTSLLLLTTLVFSQKKDDKKWDVANPPGPFKEVEFDTDEGTWMNLDVSPDGRSIVFDLLGDIYSIPMSGGKATLLRSGLPWEIQPRFSPDGSRILFTSDAGGGDNIWTMAADGSDPKQVTKETFRLLNGGTWDPSGNYIIARKHFTSQRSLGAGEMWIYHTSGGEGLQLTTRKNDQQDVNEACASADGRYVYFSEDFYPGGFFQYNKDPNSQIYVIRRFDRQEGKTEEVLGGPGGACRPQVSRDGKKLAYVRRVRTKSVLTIHDLETGEEFNLWDGLDKDQQEAWAIFGVYPGFAWTPDDRYLVVWAKGKIWKVNANPNLREAPVAIPFSVHAKHRLAETLDFENKVFEENFEAKVLRGLKTSPDGKTLVFNAAGFLWKMQLPDGKPSRLTDSKDLEFEPVFSTDGKSLAFVGWNDEQMGAIWKIDWPGGRPVKVSTGKGIYRNPAFSPDGKTLVFQKESGNDHQGFVHTKNPGIYILPLDAPDAKGAKETLVTKDGEMPLFSADGKRVFFQTGGYLFGSLNKEYKSCKPDGTDTRTHFKGDHANLFVPSPDNSWVAFVELHKLYIAPFPKTGREIGLSAGTKAVPVAEVSRDAGYNVHWSADSKSLHWTLGNEYFTDELPDRFQFLLGKGDSIPPMDSTGLKIRVTFPMDKPAGAIAFTGARILTMEGNEVIEKGDLVVEGNKITAIGKSGSVRIPAAAKKIDCSGKTIMPGIIDVHGHLGNFRYGISPQKQWEYFANLAYGVTTAHDPSSNSEMIFSQSEMIKAGFMVGPRLYSTGTIIYGADGDFKAPINSLDDAKSALRRTQAFGAFSVKSYNQPRRDQRQQVIQAARDLGMLVVPEGGSTFYHNLTQVVDGHTGIEHNIPVAPLYKDVTQLWSKTKTHNTPTLIVNYGGVNGEYFFYQNTKVWEKKRLLNFTPRPGLDNRSRHVTQVPEEEYQNGHVLVSQSCKKLQDAGVNINLGAHGQLQGLGAHWELWLLQQGGMTNHQALHCATANGAAYLGMEKEIGSLKVGKLADLLVLDKNPLDDIRNSESIRYTMLNGRLYDAETLNEMGNSERKRGKFWFEMPGSGNSWPTQTESFGRAKCLCGKH